MLQLSGEQSALEALTLGQAPSDQEEYIGTNLRMGTSSAVDTSLPPKPAAMASAPPSVRSERDAHAAERPADRRPRNQRRSRTISPSAGLSERPGSAPHVAPVGIPPGWSRDGPQAAMNFGMPYAFHVVENGVERKLKQHFIHY